LKTKSCLGIHYTNTEITVTFVEKQGSQMRITPPWQISAENVGQKDATEISPLISELAMDLNQRYKPVPPVAIALAGNFYQSQFHHSQFENAHQLEQTLHYDIEEEFAIDAESIALCYQNSPHEESGSNLIIHTVARNKLTPLLNQFDKAGMDAMAAEPDIAAWQSFLRFSGELPTDRGCVVLGHSGETVYILILDKNQKPLLTRTFPTPAQAELYQTLRCELARNLASLNEQQTPACLLYHSQGIDSTEIGNLAREMDLRCQKLTEPSVINACAVGVAVGFLDKRIDADFRNDNLQPRTVTVAYRKSLYRLSLAVCVLLLAWIVSMAVSAHRYSKIKTQAEEDIRKAWVKALHNEDYPVEQKDVQEMLGLKEKQKATDAALIQEWKKKYPDQDYPVNKVKIKRMLTDRKQETYTKYHHSAAAAASSDSTTHTLLLMLNVINKIPEEIDLRIENLNLTPKGIDAFSGTVSNLGQLDQLRTIVEAPDSQLIIEHSSFEASGTQQANDPANRPSFSMPLSVIKKVKSLEDEK
jgi:hypothetical protein